MTTDFPMFTAVPLSSPCGALPADGRGGGASKAGEVVAGVGAGPVGVVAGGLAASSRFHMVTLQQSEKFVLAGCLSPVAGQLSGQYTDMVQRCLVPASPYVAAT